MGLVQLVYTSRPFGFDSAILSGILLTARANNARDDITGCLICRGDLYMQLLEGPETAIATLWAKVQRDDRHLEVTRRVFRPLSQRMFPQWAMRDDPAQSWMWTQDDIDNGALDQATEGAIMAVFDRVRAAVA